MMKVIKVLKNIWNTFSNYREQNKHKYYKQVKAAFITTLYEYLGKTLLLSIYVATMFCYWNPMSKGFSFEVVSIITACLTTGVVTVCSIIMIVLLEGIKFIKSNNNLIVKLVKWLDKRILNSVVEELNNNIIGLMIGNIVYVAIIFNNNWSEVSKLWKSGAHMMIIYYFAIFFICGVIAPLFLNWVNLLINKVKIIVSK